MKQLFLCLLFSAFFFQMSADTTVHVVQRGETLESVAGKYGVNVQQIKEANPNMGKLFYAGLKLNIPEKMSEDSSSIDHASEKKVKSTEPQVKKVDKKRFDSPQVPTIETKSMNKQESGVENQSVSLSQLQDSNISKVQDNVEIFSPRPDLSASQIQQMVAEADPYTLYKRGRSVEYVICHGDGTPITTFTETVTNVEVRNGLQIVTVKQFLPNKFHKADITFNGKSLETFFVTEIDVNGTYHLTHDLQRDNWWKVKKRDGYAMLLPSTFSVGQRVNGGEIYDAITGIGGSKLKPHATYSNVKVEGFETLQTPAGSFDCIKITGEHVQKLTFLIKQSVTYHFTWWYAKGYGLVRCEMSDVEEIPSSNDLVMTPPYLICINKILND